MQLFPYRQQNVRNKKNCHHIRIYLFKDKYIYIFIIKRSQPLEIN